MHEIAFANSLLERRTVILGLPLRPFSLAHYLWLISRHNELILSPFPRPSEGRGIEGEGCEDPNAAGKLRSAIIQAVLICHHSHAQLLALDSDWLLGLKMRLWKRRIRKMDFALAIAEFRNYLAAGTQLPPTIAVPDDGKPGRAAGAPFALRLKLFLQREFRLNEISALDYPYRLAAWHYFAWAESQGFVWIRNHHDEEKEEFVRRMEAKIAAGMAMNDAIAEVRREDGD